MSQGSYDDQWQPDGLQMSLGDLEADYRQLLGGSVDDQAVSAGRHSTRDKNHVWTRVLTMTHLSVAGCGAFKLNADLKEA